MSEKPRYLRKLSTLEQILKIARSKKATEDQIAITLALMEGGCVDTPFFRNMRHEWMVQDILWTVREYERKFQEQYLESDWKKENFLLYLMDKPEFDIKDFGEIHELVNQIKKKRIVRYEFKLFKPMVRKDGRCRDAKKTGQQGSKGESGGERCPDFRELLKGNQEADSAG